MFTLGCWLAMRIISYTFRLSERHILASSLAKAILMSRKVFSTTFVISAVRISVVTISPSQKEAYSPFILSPISGSSAPMVRELCFSSYTIFPGMIRSGAWARWISAPTVRPFSLISGRTNRSIVPGDTVDSSTSTAPPGQTSSTCSTAPLT